MPRNRCGPFCLVDAIRHCRPAAAARCSGADRGLSLQAVARAGDAAAEIPTERLGGGYTSRHTIAAALRPRNPAPLIDGTPDLSRVRAGLRRVGDVPGRLARRWQSPLHDRAEVRSDNGHRLHDRTRRLLGAPGENEYEDDSRYHHGSVPRLRQLADALQSARSSTRLSGSLIPAVASTALLAASSTAALCTLEI